MEGGIGILVAIVVVGAFIYWVMNKPKGGGGSGGGSDG